MIKIDLTKAQDIAADKLRTLRKEKLTQLDVQVSRALVAADPDKVQEIESQRQELRDLPQKAYETETIEELKQVLDNA